MRAQAPAERYRPKATASFLRTAMTKSASATALLFAFALSAMGAQPNAGNEELKLKLPKPMFIGTPTNLKSANLEADHREAARPVLRPEGHRSAVGEEEGDLQRLQPGHRRARHDHRRREIGRRRLLRRARAGRAVGADRSRRVRTRSPRSSPGTTTARRASTAT